MRRNRFFRCGDQAIFEVFHYEAPDQDRRRRRATATSAATTSRSTSTTSTPRSPTCASRACGCSSGPTASTGAHEGQRWIYFLSPVGDAVRAGQLSRTARPWTTQPGARSHDRRSARRRGAAPGSPTTCARRSCAARSARASGSGRRRSPSGWAPAGCRCARRCGCWRPRGSPSTSANKGARVPRLTMHEVDVVYRMRERLEPLALAESMPHLDRRRPRARSRSCRSGSRPNDGRRRVPRPRPRVPPAHLHRLPDRPADSHGHPAVELHRSTTGGRSSRSSGPGRHVGGQRRAPAAARRDQPPRRRRRASATSCGHIRRTRIELGKHPEVFAPRRPDAVLPHRSGSCLTVDRSRTRDDQVT